MINHTKKIGLLGLTGLVFGSMIGSGVFNLPQNMAAGAGLGAVIISWLISGAGILFLVLTFNILSNQRPDLKAGIYQYAQDGFGNYIGFNMAWGYWIACAMSNVPYALMLNDSIGHFFPLFLNHGIPTIILGSILIWSMFFIVSRGVKEASVINTVLTVIKFVILTFIVGIIVLFFKTGMLRYDFWGRMGDIGSLGQQIDNTMLVTLWTFIGVEGAVVMSGRAKKASDVGKAGIIGFFLALVLYMLVSILSFGILDQARLAGLQDPSIAYVLRSAVGDWGTTFVIISVIISVLGGWISWTILLAEVPYSAALVKILPSALARENSKESPVFALFLSSLVMQIFMILVVTAKHVYLAAVELTSIMYLPPYLFCGLYLLKKSWQNQIAPTNGKSPKSYLVIGSLVSIYCLWTLYAGGLKLLLITSIIYAVGILVYIPTRKSYQSPQSPIFSLSDKFIATGIVLCAVISVILLAMGKASI